jgi:hypothetical protein
MHQLLVTARDRISLIVVGLTTGLKVSEESNPSSYVYLFATSRALNLSIESSDLFFVLKIYLQPTILEASETETKDHVLFLANAFSSCAMTTLQCSNLDACV